MGQIELDGNKITFDDEVSLKDYLGHDFRGNKVFDGKTIYGSSFGQETPDSEIFNDNLVAVFVKCNLDNVKMPLTAILIQCSQTRFKVQNDKNNWLIDAQDKPIKPTDYVTFEKRGLEVPKPEDIPAQAVAERVDLIKIATDKKLP